MNFYPFHIGDYASATRHLSWDEDAAYRRLLDWYYKNEKPFPLDISKVQRLVVATSKAQREAVALVLEEFFVKTDAGWFNERADHEIDAMQEKQAALVLKDAHETDRMRRYRERRATMFEALRVVEIVPAYDVSMKELQRLFDTNCNANSSAPATHLQREQVVTPATPATAIPTPTPTPTPISIKPNGLKNTALERPSDVTEETWLDFGKLRKAKDAPLTATALKGIRGEVEKAGVTLEAALVMACNRGWTSFKASWMTPESRTSQTQNPNRQEALETRIDDAAQRFLRGEK